MRKSHLLIALGLFTSTLACGGVQHDNPSDVTFLAPLVLSCPGDDNVIVGDFNGDRKPDLAGCVRTESVSVTLNHGQGAFADPQPVAMSLHTISSTDTEIERFHVEAHDINGDGFDDLVKITDTSDFRREIDIALSNGDGTFAPDFEQPAYPYGCDVDQYSFDGHAQAVCTGGGLTVKEMYSDGSSQDAFSVDTGGNTAIADVDGDGKLDLVFALGSTVAVKLGVGGGSFGATQVVLEATNTLRNVIVGDIDGDGLADLVVQADTSEAPNTDFFVHNKGALVFEVWSQMPETSGATYMFQDATGDGLLDVVVTANAQLVILVGHGDGTFDSTAVLVTGPWTIVGTALFVDLTGGGKPDLVVAGGPLSVLLRQ